MAYTVFVTETNVGFATFSTKQEAEEWMNHPDYDLVCFTDCLDSKFELVEHQ